MSDPDVLVTEYLQSCLSNNNGEDVAISNNCWIVILLRI